MKSRMLTPTHLYTDATARLDELYEKQTLLQERIRKALPGKIHISRSGGNIYYYHRTDSKQRGGFYISKKDHKKLRNLLQKSYDEKALKQVEREIKSIEQFLRLSESPDLIRDVYFSYSDESRTFIHPIDVTDEEFTKIWMSIPYEPKAITPEMESYVTDRGDMVRSKSEINISNELFKQHIPYKYEAPLQLKSGMIVYPDFTILNPRTRKNMYWEHRGMMDDRSYARTAVQRIKDYQLLNIFPGENLILTEEADNIPLGTNEIRRIIAHYLLDS